MLHTVMMKAGRHQTSGLLAAKFRHLIISCLRGEGRRALGFNLLSTKHRDHRLQIGKYKNTIYLDLRLVQAWSKYRLMIDT